MIGSLLIRGMLAGILAGLLAFGLATLIGEPQVDRAIAFESQSEPAKADAGKMSMPGMDMKGVGNAAAAEPELVSRAVQRGLGLLTAVILYGTAFGGMFALAFGFVYGRFGRMAARPTAALLAAAGFLAVYLVPMLRYPASPPAVGLPETIGPRSAMYFAMIAASIAAMVIAGLLRGGLVARLGAWNATLAGAGAYIALMAIAFLVLPKFDEVPANFPATVLWDFRIAALAIQALMWATIGLVFGAFAEAVLDRRASAASAALG